AALHPDPLSAVGGEINELAIVAIPVVGPAPPGDAAAAALLEADDGRVGRADPEGGLSCRRKGSGELHKSGIVRPRILVGAAADPEPVRDAGTGLKGELEVVARRSGGRRQLR